MIKKKSKKKNKKNPENNYIELLNYMEYIAKSIVGDETASIDVLVIISLK